MGRHITSEFRLIFGHIKWVVWRVVVAQLEGRAVAFGTKGPRSNPVNGNFYFLPAESVFYGYLDLVQCDQMIEKFLHFCKIFKVFGNFLRVYLVLVKILNPLW